MKHSSAFLALVNDAKSRINEMDIDDVKQWMDQNIPVVLIDVREESEWHYGYIPGAIHLGKGIIERDIEARYPDHDIQIVLYCGGGFRSALAADNLQKMGYRNVVSMKGGISEWKNADYPVTIT
ncbi:MAG: rhodanese-like domain-containing protein [Endozoicomonadaceae bacterium]|nr:rhodanese-like domain-containing protein [Endozoicomonadaceae bacterium]